MGELCDTSILLTALDGNVAEISSADIPGGILYLTEDGKPAIVFPDPGEGTVFKGLLKLEAKE